MLCRCERGTGFWKNYLTNRWWLHIGKARTQNP